MAQQAVSAHTPGPWRTAPPSRGRFKVCTVDGLKVVGEASNYCTDAEANARLIAAAPDLLSLCQRFEVWLSKTEAEQFARGERTYDSQGLLDLRATISQATGAT